MAGGTLTPQGTEANTPCGDGVTSAGTVHLSSSIAVPSVVIFAPSIGFSLVPLWFCGKTSDEQSVAPEFLESCKMREALLHRKARTLLPGHSQKVHPPTSLQNQHPLR